MCKKAAARKPFLAHAAANFVFAYRSPAVNWISSPRSGSVFRKTLDFYASKL